MDFVKLVGPAGVFFIMFALGLNLSLRDFLLVFRKPVNFLMGMICQALLLPIIGLILISLVNLIPEHKFGIFLLLIMPSAAMSSYATRVANGNVPLSISLTSTCALISFFTIPLYLLFFSKFVEQTNFDLNLISFSIRTFLFITIPVIIGILCRRYFYNFFKGKFFILDRSALITFLIIIFVAIFFEKDNLKGYFDDVGLIVIILLFIVFSSVFLITNSFVKDIASRRAIVIEGLLQNGAMGFVVGSILFHEISYLVPIALYAIMQYTVLLFYIGNIKIKN
tara:strand:+ start:282 stop:1124 length:843 start_codon:yes stop_codon:yes gene_type:complete